MPRLATDQTVRANPAAVAAVCPAAVEHDHPGSLIHVDVTKFGNIPDSGGHRFVGRRQGAQNKRISFGLPRSGYKPRTGTAYLHTVVDDHSRMTYVEICTDEQAATAVGVLRRAVAWYAEHGIHAERVMSDNGACYRSNDALNSLWQTSKACEE